MGLHCKDPLIHACVSINTILFLTCGWDSVDMKVPLYALICAILHRGLEPLWILVSSGVLKSIPSRNQGATSVVKFWEVKSYMWILNVQGVDPSNPNVVKWPTAHTHIHTCVYIYTYIYTYVHTNYYDKNMI